MIFSSMVVSKESNFCDLIDKFREQLRLKCIFMMSFDRMESFFGMFLFSFILAERSHENTIIINLFINHNFIDFSRYLKSVNLMSIQI